MALNVRAIDRRPPLGPPRGPANHRADQLIVELINTLGEVSHGVNRQLS